MHYSLSCLKPLEVYLQQRAHLFPSEQSLRWFIRVHRAGLIEAQALYKLRGRPLVHEERFDAYVMAAAQAGVREKQHTTLAQLHGHGALLADAGQAAKRAITMPALPNLTTLPPSVNAGDGLDDEAAIQVQLHQGG